MFTNNNEEIHRLMWKLSSIIIFVSITYNIFLRLKDVHCDGSLLKKGSFINDTKWMPNGGCAMKSYSSREIRTCFLRLSGGKPSSIYLIGDSRTRILHDSIIDGINGDQVKYQGVHINRMYTDKRLNMDINFYWYPGPSAELKYELFQKWNQGKKKILVIVMGTFLHTIKKYALESNVSYGYNVYKKNLTSLIPSFNDLASITDVLWFDQPHSVNFTHVDSYNKFIDMFNVGSKIILSKTKVKMWSSAKMIIELKPEKYKDRVHPTREIYDNYYRQILFNFMCNKLEPLPNNLCCNSGSGSKEKSKRIFIATGILCFLLLLVWIFRIRKKSLLCKRESQPNRTAKEVEDDNNALVQSTANPFLSEKMITDSIKFSVILSFIYFCEKDQLLEIEDKFEFSVIRFTLPLLFFLIPTILSIKKTNYEEIFHRDITNEMKGWMQLVMYAYCMMSANAVVPNSFLNKQLTSTYLFITGFSLFSYYWNGGGMSFKRYIQVLFRMNFFTGTFCLVLGKSYLFYYLVPIITLWFSFGYLILSLPPAVRISVGMQPQKKDYMIVLLRLTLIVIFSITISWSKDIFDGILKFQAWKFLFNIKNLNDQGLYESWSLHKLSFFYGMLFALVSNAFNQHIEEFKKLSLNFKQSIICIILGCTLMLSYYVVLIYHWSEGDYDHIHPFVVWLPILGYIVLRNSSRKLVSYYSAFLANIGIMYLEFFICLQHILLSNDAKNQLVLVQNFPVVNTVVTSFILFTTSQEIHYINKFATKCFNYTGQQIETFFSHHTNK